MFGAGWNFYTWDHYLHMAKILTEAEGTFYWTRILSTWLKGLKYPLRVTEPYAPASLLQSKAAYWKQASVIVQMLCEIFMQGSHARLVSKMEDILLL